MRSLLFNFMFLTLAVRSRRPSRQRAYHDDKTWRKPQGFVSKPRLSKEKGIKIRKRDII